MKEVDIHLPRSYHRTIQLRSKESNQLEESILRRKESTLDQICAHLPLKRYLRHLHLSKKFNQNSNNQNTSMPIDIKKSIWSKYAGVNLI